MSDRLAAKTNDDNTVDIGIAGKPGENFLRHGRIGGHVRASSVENDVDSAAHLAGYDASGFAATCAARQNKHVVADAGTAFCATIAPEFNAALCWYKLRNFFVSFFNEFALVITRNAVNIIVINQLADFNCAGAATDAFAIL